MKPHIRFFANLGKQSRLFKGMKKQLAESGMDIFYDAIVGRMLFFACVAFSVVFVYGFVMFMLFKVALPIALLFSFVSAVASGLFVMGIFYAWPMRSIKGRKTDIETNMPFVINHMSAIAVSGVPPHTMFKLIANTPEYGELSEECGRVVRNMEMLGMDVTSAIKEVSQRTPSREFRVFLNGVASTILSGGDFKKFLDQSAKEALNEYKMRRERYISTLATYADFYVGVLIAAPLFFISVMSLMAVIGGSLFGLSLPLLMALGIYVLIPILNTTFILFIHFTQPTL